MKEKTKFTKKAFAVAIASIMAISTLPFSASAAEAITVTNANGEVVFTSSEKTLDSVETYISSNKEYTINIPSGKYNADYIAVGSNTTINANDAEIQAVSNHIFYNAGNAKKYDSLSNVTITGGVWKSTSKKTAAFTMMRFLHAQNLKFLNCKMYGNYTCHLIELIGCKNVTVDSCTLYDEGSTVKNSVEEPLQIDIVTRTTAPNAYSSASSKYYDSTPCRDITINNCNIRGSRGVCANYSPRQKNENKYYHYNITLTNNVIEGKTSEAVALFNTAKITVKNNKITTRRKGNTAYSVGLNIQMMNKVAKNYNPAKYPVVISGNTIKGDRQGVCMYSHVGKKWGKTTLKKNKLYARSGKKNAYKIDKKTVTSLKKSSNKTYAWK